MAIAVDVFLSPFQERIVAEMLRNATDMPPDVRQWLELMSDRASAPLRLAGGFLFQLAAGLTFAPVGGALGAAFFRPAAGRP